MTAKASSRKHSSPLLAVTPIVVGGDHVACDDCELVVDTLTALTRYRVELGFLEGPLQLCARCSPGGLATYWTRDLEEHLVATLAEWPKHPLLFHCKL